MLKDKMAKRVKDFFKKSFTTEELFWNTEVQANMLVGFAMLVMSIVLVFAWVLNTVGVFEIDKRKMTLTVIYALIELIVPCIICNIFKGEKKWLKYVMMIELIIVLARLDSVLNYNVTLCMVIPIVLSCRYFNQRFSIQIAGITSGLFFVSALFGALLNMGGYDLNFAKVPAGTWIQVGSDFYQSIVNAGIDQGRYVLLYMLECFVPKLLAYFVIAIICIRMAGRGKEMVLEQAEISSENARIESELSLATDIQANMLPTIFPAFPDREEFDIYATMNPAKEVGGDFYDFFMVDEKHIAIVMADVSGKGVPAALFMVIAKTLIKDHTLQNSDLGAVFSTVNDMLCESNSEGLFVTAFEGVLDLETGEFNFVNAGHELPFICKKDGKYEPYEIKHGFVLAGMEGVSYTSGKITLDVGDRIFQYTDGVTEATDIDNRLYGMNRLEKILCENSKKSPSELLPAVKDDIDNFVGVAPQFDDITMLCLEYKKKMTSSSD